MSLITISGYPSSGKSTRAHQLKLFLESNECHSLDPKQIFLLSEHSSPLNIHRDAYNDSASEKPARAALLSAITRLMSPRTILIVDAPNYIKGFRYQIYCAARELKVRVCTVYVVAPQEQCRKWNALREGKDRYSDETLENLFMRYEEPSSMVRWDSPLFTVLWDDENVPGEAIYDAITTGRVVNPNSGTVAVAKAPTDALLALEKTTLAIVSRIMAAQDGFGGQLTFPSTGKSSLTLTLPPRHITLSELQRLKRQFVTINKKAITLGTVERGSIDWEEDGITERFVTFLAEHLG